MYVNYAGGTVENISFEKEASPLPINEQETLQKDIVKQFGLADPSQHSSWVSRNSLGPAFVYRTERETESKLYPAMNITVNDNTYTIGTTKPADEAAIHYFTLGSNGSQIDFMNKQPYSASNSEQKEQVNAAVDKMIAAVNGGDSVMIKTQVVYAETPFIGDTYPQVVYSEPGRTFPVQKILAMD